MDYCEWNFRLIKYYFKPEMAGKEVILFADTSVIEDVGSCDKVGIGDFINAIKKGPDWVLKYNNICEKAYYAFYNWRKRVNPKHPPYVAYLIFFVCAAGMEGDFSEIAYYPRLNSLLGEEIPNIHQHFRKMYELWKDLETWSKVDKRETIGRFTSRVRGPWVHVGLPLSQTLITESERKKLPQFFAKNDFDPTSPPSLDLITNAIQNSNLFHAKTKKLLNNSEKEKSYLKNSFFDIVLEELQAWDGIIVENGLTINNENNIPSILTHLKICIKYDSLSQIAKTIARFKTNCPFPEEEFLFVKERDNTTWACKESIPSWSTPLTSSDDNKPADASLFNWLKGETFLDKSMGWKAKLKPAKLRIFFEGKREGLSEWVEVNQGEINTKCIIACHKSLYLEVSRWGANSCEGFKELTAKGLPSDWYLFYAYSIYTSHQEIDVLKLPVTQSLQLNGGIKSGSGNTYFKFGLPKVTVNGATGNEVVKINGEVLAKNDEGTWIIPDYMPVNVPLKIELVSNNGKDTRYRTIILENTHMTSNFTLIYRNRFGILVEQESEDCSISGVYVKSSVIKNINPYSGELPTYLSNRIIFLGKQAGQYVNWPKEKLPEWTPVWAVAKIGRDKWRSYFVGGPGELKVPSKLNKEMNKWKKWKNTFKKAKVESFLLPQVAELWLAYQREANKL